MVNTEGRIMVAKRKGRATSSQMHPVRHYLAARDKGWVCWYCEAPVECPTCTPGSQIPGTLDHIKPRAKGGNNAISNLRLSCLPCNRDKADHASPEEGRRATRRSRERRDTISARTAEANRRVYP